MALVLLVEDDDQVRVLAESILQEGGHQTLAASTAEQALALLTDDKQSIDLVFTDIGLHSDTQAGLLMAQEAIKRAPDTPVLYTTGQGLSDGLQAMFVERFGFLAKPYTAEQVLTAIENLLPKS
jgi:DNA-binding NtrC family response regulator